MSRFIPPAVPVEYPDSDGKPMSENDWQLAAILYGIGALRLHFAERQDVYVSGDMFIYYEEGNPAASIVPDIYVVIGAANHKRRSYKLWEEPKAPDFVMEVASPSTWREDLYEKPKVYERMGVKEYWQYDPTGEHFSPFLRGLRLESAGYERQPVVESLDRTLTLHSETLGLDLRAKGDEMRFHDPVTGRDLLDYGEEHAARQAAEVRAETAESRAETAETRAEAAEARVGELEAFLRKQRD